MSQNCWGLLGKIFFSNTRGCYRNKAPFLPILISLPYMWLCGASAALLWPGIAELEMFSQDERYSDKAWRQKKSVFLLTWLNHCNKSSNVNSWDYYICEKGYLYCCCCYILNPVGQSRTHCQPPFVLTSRHLEGIPWLLSMVLRRKHLQFCYSFIFLLSSQSQVPFHQYFSPFLFLKIFSSSSIIAWGISSQVIPTSHFFWLSLVQLFGSTCLPSSAQLLLSLPGHSLLASFCLNGSPFSSEAWLWGVFCAFWGIWTVTSRDLGPWVPSQHSIAFTK